jgi:hypothetical protein
MGGDYPKLSRARQRDARIAAMERLHARAKERASHVIEEAEAEIERSHELLDGIAHLAGRSRPDGNERSDQ